jgi:hypothetical protein
MRVFLDLEASSLAKAGYPVEVGWVFENGQAEGHLICPAPGWDDWDAKAEAIHRIPRETLLREGESVERVAARMVEVLSGHDLFASAPSWDGKWLSLLLRAGGQPRHALRLRDSDDLLREEAAAGLRGRVPDGQVAAEASLLLAGLPRKQPAHRALADAQEERTRWLIVRDRARTWPAGANAA